MIINNTIAAIATPIGAAGIGVIRISGAGSINALSAIFKTSKKTAQDYASHTAHFGKLVDPITGIHIDDAVATVFINPKSYTGEDVVEISCHGGPAVLKAVLGAVLNAGCRLAEPGEFTKRAFLNGKIDLAQAEAVNDLIRAKTDGSRRIALSQLDGALSSKIKTISDKLLRILASVEAAIDFPEDVAEPDLDWVKTEIETSKSLVERLIMAGNSGRILREGLRVAIAGNVNVGKSSLLNALLKHARAIVTPIPGTTRDVIEESLEIQGIPVVAIDTAGIRLTDDPIEKVGVQRTHETLETADLVLLVVDAVNGLSKQDTELIQKVQDRSIILVFNKIDLVSSAALTELKTSFKIEDNKEIKTVLISAAAGTGIEELESEIANIVLSGAQAVEGAFVSNMRHQEALKSASISLANVLETLQKNLPIDFLSVDIMSARYSLGLITGETAAEDLLDRIFSEFCIGK